MKTSISRAEFIGSCRFDAMEWRQSVDFFCRNEVCGGSSPQRVQGSILVSSTCSQSTRVLRAPAPVTPPSTGLRAHKHTARACPDSVSRHQWPWHKIQTFNNFQNIVCRVFLWNFSQAAFSCDIILIVFGYHHSLNCHFSDKHLYKGSCLTTDDVNWDGSKCQGRKLKLCD